MTLKIAAGIEFEKFIQTITTSVLGIRGSGKTHTATVIVEELLKENLAVIIIDPLDVWWGLKSSKDGDKPGFPVIIAGGTHADIPLAEGDGEVLADFVVENPVPMVFSLRHLSKAAQNRFVLRFTTQLYHRKGEAKHRTPLMVVIDECDLFVPQRFQGDKAATVGAIEDIVRRGRSAGLGCMLISQRASSVNKDVLTQSEIMVAHQHTAPHDRKALLEWVEAHDSEGNAKDFMGSLASLKKGEAWFWAPGLNVFSKAKVRDRLTFDSSGTPTSGRVRAPKKLADIDLDLIRSKLSKSIEEAKGKDPTELKKKIEELEATIRQLREKEPPPAINPITEEERQLLDLLLTQMQHGREAIEAVLGRVENVRDVHYLENVPTGLQEARPFISTQTLRMGKHLKVSRSLLESEGAKIYGSSKVQVEHPVTPGKSGLGKCDFALLQALSQHGSSDRTRLALLTGYSPTSGGFSTAIKNLKDQGLIIGAGAGLEITAAGEKRGPFPRLPTGQALRDFWLASPRLSLCAKMVLKLLMANYPRSLPRDQIAELTDYSPKSGGFSTALKELKDAKLATAERGQFRAAEDLF